MNRLTFFPKLCKKEVLTFRHFDTSCDTHFLSAFKAILWRLKILFGPSLLHGEYSTCIWGRWRPCMRMLFVSGSYQNDQNGAVSKQLTHTSLLYLTLWAHLLSGVLGPWFLKIVFKGWNKGERGRIHCLKSTSWCRTKQPWLTEKC